MTSADANTVLSAKPRVARRVTWSERIPRAELKAIGHATGTTVNDVLTTAMTGALRRYLLRPDSLVDEIRMTVPDNLRPPGPKLRSLFRSRSSTDAGPPGLHAEATAACPGTRATGARMRATPLKSSLSATAGRSKLHLNTD